MTLDAFLANQNSIYATLRAMRTEVERSGVKTEKNLSQRRGAFTVALKYPPRVASALAGLSRSVAALVPSVVYGEEEIHTTLGAAAMRINFLYDADDQSQRQLLESLCRAAACAAARSAPSIEIEFDDYIVTPEVVLAPGRPSQSFVDLVGELVREAAHRGVALQPAWGAHVTVARFKGEAAGQYASALLTLMGSSRPIGRSIARRVAVGYSLWKQPPESRHISPEHMHGQFLTHWECTLGARRHAK